MDGRRHSIDLPISRTLIALRRVRSLRDPSTNSMSKLSTLVDNLNWETNSNNGITLGFDNDRDSTPERSLHFEGSDMHSLHQEIVCDNKLISERYGKYYGEGGQEFNLVEDGVSCNEPYEISMQDEKRQRGESICKSWHRKLDGLSCYSEAQKERLSCGMSLYRNEDVGFMESCHQGCGISSCWSKTRKFRDSNLYPDVEEKPLLLAGESEDWKHNTKGVSLYTEIPRSLCQKFMPKSFDELVGQSTVSTSLSNAISNRQISSLYLFHGPCGTGKTSTSRIFAAALNCLSSEIARPCGLCQECALFFSGRSRDVKELESVRINRTERCRSLVKNAGIPPVYSRFKIYVIDECHLLHPETWATILNCVEELPRHVVFIMVTSNIDKLPRCAVSKSQTFRFQKVKEVDITSRLGRICVQEGLDFDQDALNFIATKSNGSLRNAEMMLDQLSLLGKRISMSLVYEVNRVVSDDELLDLLHLALSSDASNTVKKARELMRSRIDPVQLVSQLANLIMDILAGKFPDGVSEVRRKLFGTDNSETDMQQLSHALKILSQTEKQLRMSKNQITWLTVALLQLSSARSSHDVNDASLSMRASHSRDGDFHSGSSTGESLKLHPAACRCEDIESEKIGMRDDKEILELVWMRATQMCTPSSLKKFLLKRGNLVSICLTQASIAVAELEFDSPDYVSKAEKSWKVIAAALQHLLGCNVELRINLDSNKHGRLKKSYFGLFNCSRRGRLRSQFSTEYSSTNVSDNSDLTPTTIVTRDKYVETCSSESMTQVSHMCCHGKVLFKTIRSNNGNALSIGENTHNRTLPDSMAREVQSLGAYPSNNQINKRCSKSVSFEPENEPGPKASSKFHCWKTAMSPFQKAWQLRHHTRSERLVDYALHCAAAK